MLFCLFFSNIICFFTRFIVPLHIIMNTPKQTMKQFNLLFLLASFKNWGGYKRFVNKRLITPAVLFSFVLPFLLTACSKDDATENTPRTPQPARTDSLAADSSAADTGGIPLRIDTTWADTIRVNWDSLGTDTTDTTKFDTNTDVTEGDAGGAASRMLNL